MGQTSLFGSGWTLGRPRGRFVDSVSNRRAMDSTQRSPPSGTLRLGASADGFEFRVI